MKMDTFSYYTHDTIDDQSSDVNLDIIDESESDYGFKSQIS